MTQKRLLIPRDYPYPEKKLHDANATRWEKIQDNFDDLYLRVMPDTTGGWRDMIGQIVPRANVPTSPTWTQMGTSPFWAYLFAVNDEVWIPYHLQHDYKPGTDIYLHVHWTSNGTSTAQVTWMFEWTYASGYSRGVFDIEATSPLSHGTEYVVQAATGTAWTHMIAEIATPISHAEFEVDGLILCHIKRVANIESPQAANSDNIFMLTADCHYETDRLNTAEKNYPFY